MPRARGRIIVAGNLSIDDTVTAAGTRAAAPGGDALYSALGVRVWGLPVGIVSRVGEDYPDEYLRKMEDAGIAIDGIVSQPGPTIHFRIAYRTADDRTFEHLTSVDRLDILSPGGQEVVTLGDAPWVHIAAMPIAQQVSIVEACRRMGVEYSLDPHEEYVAPYRAELRALLNAGTFLPSELEADLLFPDFATVSDPRARAQRVAAACTRCGATTAAIKLGALGSYVVSRGRGWNVPAVPVASVDPTGAGDAYCGGFIAGMVATGLPLAAAACGTLSAAYIIQGFGAFDASPPAGPWLHRNLRSLLKSRFDGEGDRALAALEDAFAHCLRQ